MPHTLLHICGPISIHSYGVMIASGLLLFNYLIRKDPRFSKLNLDSNFNEILLVGNLAALFGGRSLFLLSHPENIHSFFAIITFWEPGFSILGAIGACVAILPIYLKRIGVPIMPMLDLAAIYTPLLQSVSRVGCFFAGCCYGASTTLPWGIIYTDPESVAPLYSCIHPTQIYSALILLLIFTIMYFVLNKILTKSGQLLCAYLMLQSIERFTVDFYRGDQITSSMLPHTFSLYQYVALGMFIGAFLGFTYFTLKKST